MARQNATISDATRRECDPAPQLSADRAPNEPNRAQMVAPAAPAPRAAAAPAAAPPPASSSAVKGGGFLSTLLKQREAMLAKSEAVKTTKTCTTRSSRSRALGAADASARTPVQRTSERGSVTMRNWTSSGSG